MLTFNYSKIIKSLLDKNDNFVIKEEELLSKKEEVVSFKLLKGIQGGNYWKKYLD